LDVEVYSVFAIRGGFKDFVDLYSEFFCVTYKTVLAEADSSVEELPVEWFIGVFFSAKSEYRIVVEDIVFDIGECDCFYLLALRKVNVGNSARVFFESFYAEVNVIPTAFKLFVVGDILVDVGLVLGSIVRGEGVLAFLNPSCEDPVSE
jgi:hypothetical protein